MQKLINFLVLIKDFAALLAVKSYSTFVAFLELRHWQVKLFSENIIMSQIFAK